MLETFRMACTVSFCWYLTGFLLVVNTCTEVHGEAGEDSNHVINVPAESTAQRKSHDVSMPSQQKLNTKVTSRGKRYTYEEGDMGDPDDAALGYGEFDLYGALPYDLSEFDLPGEFIEGPEVGKRQMSRWNYLHSVLQKARENYKPSGSKRMESPDVLDSYNFNLNKRQGGRWRNLNMLLNKVRQKYQN